MGWGRTAIRGRKPTPHIGPSYCRRNHNKRRLPIGRRACKRDKPDHMSEPGRSLLLKRYPSSKSPKPDCALELPRNRHNTSALGWQAILISSQSTRNRFTRAQRGRISPTRAAYRARTRRWRQKFTAHGRPHRPAMRAVGLPCSNPLAIAGLAAVGVYADLNASGAVSVTTDQRITFVSGRLKRDNMLFWILTACWPRRSVG